MPAEIEGWVEDGKRGMVSHLGTAGGPAVTAGSMLLYKVALALFIGQGPLFILCLPFDQTKQLFQKWLFYGIGTMFLMAVLAAMITIALDIVIRVRCVPGAAAGRYGIDPHDAGLTAPPNGGDVLPGHAGWLRGIFADRRYSGCSCADCEWTDAG